MALNVLHSNAIYWCQYLVFTVTQILSLIKNKYFIGKNMDIYGTTLF